MTVSVEHPQLPLGLALRDSARFESYFAGDNGEAVAALRSAADRRGEALVYLAGQPGLGKTHLLQAACHQAGQCGLTATYLPMQELVALSPDMLDGLEQMALVCLDDIEAIAGHAEWEEAVFDLFNRVRAAGNVMLIAGVDTPARCGLDLPDLVSRLGWGLTYTLKPLDETQLQAALELRAKGRGTGTAGGDRAVSAETHSARPAVGIRFTGPPGRGIDDRAAAADDTVREVGAGDFLKNISPQSRQGAKKKHKIIATENTENTRI